MKRLLEYIKAHRLGLAILCLIAAGYASSAELDLRYKFYQPPTTDQVCLRVIFKPEADIIRDQGASGRHYEGSPVLIISPTPKDFNDERALYILGHELLHALGAYHD